MEGRAVVTDSARRMPVDFPVPGPAFANPAARSRAGGSGPAELYHERSGTGLIRADPAQQRAVARLQLLHEALLAYRPPARRGRLARLLGAEHAPAMPRGLYLWGPVGRGKSMLMDLVFAAAPVANKRRVHFHAFMLAVHYRLERERRAKTRQRPRPAAVAPEGQTGLALAARRGGTRGARSRLRRVARRYAGGKRDADRQRARADRAEERAECRLVPIRRIVRPPARRRRLPRDRRALRGGDPRRHPAPRTAPAQRGPPFSHPDRCALRGAHPLHRLGSGAARGDRPGRRRRLV